MCIGDRLGIYFRGVIDMSRSRNFTGSDEVIIRDELCIEIKKESGGYAIYLGCHWMMSLTKKQFNVLRIAMVNFK